MQLPRVCARNISSLQNKCDKELYDDVIPYIFCCSRKYDTDGSISSKVEADKRYDYEYWRNFLSARRKRKPSTNITKSKIKRILLSFA